MANGNTIRTRQNALNLPQWDPTLLWYAKAVAAMKARPLNDATSWRYQTAVHGFAQNHPDWQPWLQGQVLPSSADRKMFWARCQHGTWYFLPWHRMYLGYFEKIVRAVIISLNGPADWALPYWNYNHSAASGKLPLAFTQSKLPDGSANPLLEPNRNQGNNGAVFLDQRDIDPIPALSDDNFTSGAPGSTPGFGGAVTPFNHSAHSMAAFGLLELSPHNQVHGDIGGLMGDPDTAAYDPIFWLHHANIDRLWEVWLKVNVARANPTLKRWQNFVFHFKDAQAGAATLTPHDILDSKAAPFYYQYDDISVPAGVATGPLAVGTPHTLNVMAEEPMPEMVGASSEATPLAGESKTMRVRLFPMSGPAAMHALGASESNFRKAYLNVENVRGKGQPASYRIYLNAPEGPGEPPENFRVGTIPIFGLEKASIGTELHPGNGLRFSFNVTEIINRLKAENLSNPESMRVTFIPTRKATETSSIEVGRVSLYFS